MPPLRVPARYGEFMKASFYGIVIMIVLAVKRQSALLFQQCIFLFIPGKLLKAGSKFSDTG